MRNLLNLNDPTLLRTDAYIDGRWTATDARFAVIDPATGEDLADVADCDAATTSLAISAAHAAQRGWAARLPLERSTLLKQALLRGSAQVLFEYACEAYRRREVTLSRAGELAGITLREFLLRLPDADLQLNYGVSDLTRDLEA